MGPYDPELDKALGRLDERQRAFFDRYLVNGRDHVDAAGHAGYPFPVNNARRILESQSIQRALIAYAQATGDALDPVRDAEGLLAMWGRMCVDPKVQPKDRLRASQLLGKALGVLSDTVTIETAAQRAEREARLEREREAEALVDELRALEAGGTIDTVAEDV